MVAFDESQERVLALDPRAHARVLGAPGSGKTSVLVEAFARTLDRDSWSEGDVLALAPNRLAATSLRQRVIARLDRPIGGTPVRTTASLGFAVLTQMAAMAGEEAPRLLTGTVHDEAIAAVITDALARRGAGSLPGGFPDDVLVSAAFRAELRELWRVADDFGWEPLALADHVSTAAAKAGSAAHGGAPDPTLAGRWRAGLQLIAAVSAQLAASRPGELAPSRILRSAADALRKATNVGATGLPRLVLVDDAQELGEGELALLAALADTGSAIWVFGDPDTATGAFHGERTAVLAHLAAELGRRGVGGVGAAAPEQSVVLESVHRHGAVLRGFVRELTRRIGTGGVGEQRRAESAVSVTEAATVQFAVAASPAEQLGVIAHRLRAGKLGLGDTGERRPLDWSDMAVICRSRGEAARVARALAAHQVPTGVSAGGIVLREHQVVRELIRVLQHALGIAPLTATDVLGITGGVLGGLDPVAVRRLRAAILIEERRVARDDGRDAEPVEAVISREFAAAGPEPFVDSAGGRVLRRLARLTADASRVRDQGGTPRETLWAIWDGTKLAGEWQEDALGSRGARADEASRALDAVMGLFFALQRHEEQDSEQPIAALLEDLLTSTVPEDSLAQRSERASVTVTTPQGALGQEFTVVAIVGVQDGAWPNLRARGSLLGTAALERWLRGGEALPPSRRDTVHDELRLFAHGAARSNSELLVVAISDEDQHPSPFFTFGSEHRVDGLPSSRLTLRGAIAQMRRRLTLDPGDAVASASLAALAREGVPGAHPDEWYGMREPSTDLPLFDLSADPDLRVPVSPSKLEQAEECALDWVIDALGGGTSNLSANLGTLVHHAFEHAEGANAEQLLDAVLAEWDALPFDADWESERTKRLAAAMTDGLATYLREFQASDRELAASEAFFRVELGRAELRGMADRIELGERADGSTEATVVDLKTGKHAPSKPEAEVHAQMQAYQLGIELGEFVTRTDDRADADESAGADERLAGARSGGARLLYVHPDARGRADFTERAQEPLTAEGRDAFIERVQHIASVMAAGSFTARVEHHCTDPYAYGSCQLHIIPAVSHA